LLLLLAPVLRAASITNFPYSGIIWWEEKRSEPPMHWFVTEIDLKNPNIRLHVACGGPDPDGPGPWQTILVKPTAIAERESFDLVINGDFFTHRKLTGSDGTNAPAAPLWGSAQGPAVTDGHVWSTSATKKPCLVVHKNRRVTIEMVGQPRKDDWQVLAGNPMLVQDGLAVPHGATVRHPRTAVGLDRKAARLVILTVDGRKKGEAVGMSYDELANEFLRLGCWKAVNLDGGGSTAIALREPGAGNYLILNAPTDGYERPVAEVLGVTTTIGNKVRK
jgi:exopolysaccharide biosynthesis protein